MNSFNSEKVSKPTSIHVDSIAVFCTSRLIARLLSYTVIVTSLHTGRRVLFWA